MSLDIDTIKRNAECIRKRIQSAAQGREVLFCAACKTQSTEVVRAASRFDFDLFGENRAQELERNWTAQAYGTKPVHFIGRLQSRKVRQVVGRAALIHSVDSERLLQLVNAQAQSLGIRQAVLIEVNIGCEDSKGGVAPEQLEPLLATAGRYPWVLVRGLMTIPPIGIEISQTRIHFENLYKLFIDTGGKTYDNVTMDWLSMGMSHDYELAVACGANLVRIGSALFGPRQ